jgi:hypothetical protein
VEFASAIVRLGSNFRSPAKLSGRTTLSTETRP